MVTRARQKGVALITVLLVFALVAVIATEMLRRSQLSLRSVGNLVETRQAYYYALGGEAYARQLLAKDVINGHGDIDSLNEAWAQTKDQQPFEIDDGNMQIEINDLQGRFNLNSVVDAKGLYSQRGIDQFKALLNVLQLNPNYAYEWTDWVDRDQMRAPNGAEDADYPNYRTASRAETDISALRLLRSMKPEDYAKLAPHVAVLPPDVTAVNVNTADAEVLRSLSPTLSESQAAQIVAQQQNGGYIDVASVPGLGGVAASVSSNFFEVVVTVNYANRWQRVRTVLQRKRNENGQVEIAVVSRVRSPLIDDIGF
ncbi:MAG TPA: type II secretion system minor pseudopilin GspK [Spongiibacteraceae bacterium]|nr:type II secretion system minor pseudopilin GspK [Spongiibacteraceae bacterium]